MPPARVSRLFGLTILSDIELPNDGALVSGHDDVDVTIRRLRPDVDRPSELNASEQPTTTVWSFGGLTIGRTGDGRRYCMQYDDGAIFVIDREHSEILVDGPLELAEEDFAIYLLGPVCGLLLYLLGETCLHGSAIACDGKAIAFVGGAEAGKSTLAAQYARLGYHVLTDDVLLLRETADGAMVIPSVPRIGLWPRSVAHIWGDEDALPKQVSTWEKRFFDLSARSLFQESALPLAAIYVLGDRESTEAPLIDPLRGADAALALIANKYVTRITDKAQDRRDFLTLSNLTRSLPIRRVLRRDALSDLSPTCETILADYAELAGLVV